MNPAEIVFRWSGRWSRPADPGGGPGFFFATRTPFAAGNFVARFQLAATQPVPPDTPFALEVIAWGPDGPVTLARSLRRWTPDLAAASDDMLVFFRVERPAELQFRCWARDGVDRLHLRSLTVKRADQGRLEDWSWPTHRYAWPPDHIRNITIGTTGLCNARCPICPTSLAEPLAEPGRASALMMPDALFEKLIAGVAESGLPVRGGIGFGLFGEPLLDRKVVEKARLVRRLLPDSRIVVSTNGAAFAPKRHAELAALGVVLSVHVEAFEPALYDRLMTPLKAAQVFPRIAAIPSLWGRRAKLAVPTHRENLQEHPKLHAWWTSLGGGEAIALPITNRCSWNPAATAQLLWPVPTSCRQEKAYSLVVDHDGTVLACCDDFTKGDSIGDLRTETVAGLMANDARRRLFDALREQRWSSLPYCRRCFATDHARVKAALAGG